MIDKPRSHLWQSTAAIIHVNYDERIDDWIYYIKDAACLHMWPIVNPPEAILCPECERPISVRLLRKNALIGYKYRRQAAAEFLAKPEASFFVVTEKTEADLLAEAGKNKLILLDVDAFSGKEDVVGAKLLKAFQQIRNQLKFYDFEIVQGGWKWNKKKKALFWYVIPPKDLMKIKKWVGPPLREKERVKNFKTKYKKTFVEDGRMCTYVKRRFVKVEDLIDEVIKNDEHLYEKVKKVVRK